MRATSIYQNILGSYAGGVQAETGEKGLLYKALVSRPQASAAAECVCVGGWVGGWGQAERVMPWAVTRRDANRVGEALSLLQHAHVQ